MVAYSTKLPVPTTIQRRMVGWLVNQKGYGAEVFVAYFEITSRHPVGRNDNNHS